jgi:hypothetical protein
MTPTPTVLLLVALFWTLPASAAMLMYRKHDRSIKNLRASMQRRFDRASEALQQPQTQSNV